MPRITRLVVCGRLLVIATLAPTRALGEGGLADVRAADQAREA